MGEGDPHSNIPPEILAQYLAAEGVRNNGELEDLHAGMEPISAMGDNSDVFVVTPSGKIQWNDVSRFSDHEMRALMLSIEDSLTLAIRALQAVTGGKDSEALREYIRKRRSYDDPAYHDRTRQSKDDG